MTHGVEGMLYIIKITNTQYNLVYGRDFFDDDKFFTLVQFPPSPLMPSSTFPFLSLYHTLQLLR